MKDTSEDIIVYETVLEAQNIIGTLVDTIYNDGVYQKYLSDLETESDVSKKKADIIKKTFHDIKVFNTNTEPLFLARDIGILMGITNINSAIKNYNKSEKIIGYIIQKGIPKEKQLLTRYGVYRILFNSRTKLSELFRGFIYKLLDHMFQHEIDKLKSIINEYSLNNQDLVKDSILELYENANRFKILYEKEKKERMIWMDKAEEGYDKILLLEAEKDCVEISNTYNEMLINQLRIDNNFYLKKMRVVRNEYEDQNEEQMILNSLKKTFLKEINIFIAKPKFVEKMLKKNGIIYDEMKKYEYEYNYVIDSFQRDIVLSGNIELYYYIVFKSLKDDDDKYAHICTEWVVDRVKFKELLQILENESDNIKVRSAKNETLIFRTTLENIKSVVRNLLINMPLTDVSHV